MKKMVEQGDGSFQKAIDDSRCPKCLAVIDYTREFAHCKSCNLTMHGAGIRKEKRPASARTTTMANGRTSWHARKRRSMRR